MSPRPKESCRDRRKATGHGQTGWCEAATSRAGRRGPWPRGSSERDLACWPGARTSGHSAVCHPPGQREADLHPELKEGVPATFGQLGCSAYPMSGAQDSGACLLWVMGSSQRPGMGPCVSIRPKRTCLNSYKSEHFVKNGALQKS